MMGRKAEAVLNRSLRHALENKHEYFTLEHVLLSLLDEKEIRDTIAACNGDPIALKAELTEHLGKEIPKALPLAPEVGGSELGSGKVEHPVATLSIQRLIQRALFQVQSSGKDEIKPIDLLIALFQAKDSHALYLLQSQGIERLDVINYVSHGLRKDGSLDPDAQDAAEDLETEEGNAGAAPQSNKDPLEAYTLKLNERAQEGKIDPLVGRELELERVVQTLCRRRKNNPLLVGEAGVGKTAIAEGLASRIVNKKVPAHLESCEVYSLDLGSLIAGAKFRGDFEQRLKQVIQALKGRLKVGKQPILYIDEIHTIIGAGSVGGGTLDAANLLKPLLTQGEIRCMGSTTYSEYRTVFEKDHALARRFQKIDVTEPTQEEAIQILNGLKPKFEEHHQVQYTPEAIRASVELSVKHLTDRHLPDKAIDVMDEAGARARISGGKVIDGVLIEEMIAKIARIPARTVNTSQKSRLQSLERDLKLSIFGQGEAIEAVVTAIRLARSGLRSGERPVGNFLFCGPTGVGKTELSKQLAHALGVPFLRFDMSEYGERHTVSRLIGAPPGYVGFEQAGLLTDQVLKNPHAVLLLDEIEKAHPEIYNILLQVMDHGTLTDSNGRKVDFRNVILLMTSNVGSRELERRAVGIEDNSPGAKTTASASRKEVERVFTPEFRNRLDAIVYFNALEPVVIAQVVGKVLVELETQLLAKQVEIEFDPLVREWLAQKGYDKTMGARPMNRLIQDRIKKPLASEILFGKLEQGGRVQVVLKDGEPDFVITPATGREKSGLLSANQVIDG